MLNCDHTLVCIFLLNKLLVCLFVCLQAPPANPTDWRHTAHYHCTPHCTLPLYTALFTSLHTTIVHYHCTLPLYTTTAHWTVHRTAHYLCTLHCTLPLHTTTAASSQIRTTRQGKSQWSVQHTVAHHRPCIWGRAGRAWWGCSHGTGRGEGGRWGPHLGFQS